MKAYSKMIAAVLAVVVMMGCALVPLTVPVNGETETESNDDLGEFSLETFIEQIREMGNDLKELRFANVTLVPTIVDTSGNEDVVIGDVEGMTHIKKDQTATINSGIHKFKVSNSQFGRLIIEAGAELVLLDGPRGFENTTTFVDGNNPAYLAEDYVIKMETGSILNVFGVQFRVIVNHESGVFHPLVFMKNEKRNDPLSVTFYKTADASNKVTFWMDVNEQWTVVKVADVATFYGHLSTDVWEHDLKITGTSVQSENGYKFTDGKITVDMRRGLYYWSADSIHVDEFSIYFTGSKEPLNISSTVNVKLTTGPYEIMYFLDKNDLGAINSVMVTGFNFEVKNLTFGIGASDSGIEIGVSCENFSMDIGSASYYGIRSGIVPITMIFIVTDFGFKFQGEVFTIDVTFDEEGQTSVDTKMKSSIEMHLGSAKGHISNTGGTVVWDHTFITDLTINVPDIDLEYRDGTGTCTIGDIVASGKTPADDFILSDYEVTFIATLSGFESVITDSTTQSKYDMELVAKAKMDGVERTLVAKADNIVTSTRGTEQMTTIDEISLINGLPTDVLVLDIPANSEIHIYDVVIGDKGFVAERATLSMGENGPFDCFYMELSGNVNLDIDLPYFGIKCDTVKGYFANVGKDIVRFGVTDGAEFEITNFGKGFMEIYFEKGNAFFNGGKLPFNIIVEKGASFHAEGLVAKSFAFLEGSKLSGTVSIDTEFSPSSHIRFGTRNITIDTTDGCGDYVFTMDLETKNSGKLNAKTGCLFPTAYSKDGFTMKSDDQKVGTFTVANSSVTVKIPMDRESFTLSYEGNIVDPEQHKYEDKVLIPDKIPEKEGYLFWGWTDGSGNMCQPGDEYTMPARDVTLTPVYYKEASAKIVVEGGKKIAVVDGKEADIVNFDGGDNDWDILRVTTNGTTVEMTKESFQKLSKEQLYLVTNKVSHFGTDFAEYEGDVVLYSVKLANIYGESPDYYQDTEFKVSFDVYAGSGVNNINVWYVDGYGHTHKVLVDGYEDLGNGYYRVTFNTNHFSNFMVTYEYGNSVDTTLVTIIGIAVILIFVFGLLMTFHLRNGKKS